MNATNESVGDIVGAVRAAGKRVTNAKRTVAHVLAASSKHLTADQIALAAQREQPDVSQSTIYRILDEFEQLHVVEHAHLGHSATVYHLARAAHGHLVCANCGVTIEAPAAHFDALSRELLRDFDFLLDRHHVAISGLCGACHALRGS